MNADSILLYAALLSNCYCYVKNNPTTYFDPDGFRDKLPFKSTPFDYQRGYNSHGELYERWYGADGYPVNDRHWSDHGAPNSHTNPHDHYWERENPGEAPKHENRRQINDPPERWEGQDEWEKDKEEYEKENSSPVDYGNELRTAGIWVCGGVIVYCLGKLAIAVMGIPATGGASLLVLVTP